jgi:Na+/glutamate symporter
MSIEAWIALTSAEIGIIVTAIAGIKWLVKKYLSELRPNGGSSDKDQVNRLELRVDEIYRLLVEK